MADVFFEDIEVGDLLPLRRVTLTGEQVRHFAAVAHIEYRRFESDEAARAEGLPGQIAPGNISMALFSKLLTEWADGIRLRRMHATFRQLVHPNVPLVVHGVITEKPVSPDPVVSCDLVVESAAGDRLVTGTATFVLPRRQDALTRESTAQ